MSEKEVRGMKTVYKVSTLYTSVGRGYHKKGVPGIGPIGTQLLPYSGTKYEQALHVCVGIVHYHFCITQRLFSLN